MNPISFILYLNIILMVQMFYLDKLKRSPLDIKNLFFRKKFDHNRLNMWFI